jgi:hypothetical protein
MSFSKKKPFLPKEYNAYFAKLDVEKKEISRPVYKKTRYRSGYVSQEKLWLWHSNALSAYSYIDPQKPLFPPKFDYSQYLSPEKLGLTPRFSLYGSTTLHSQPLLLAKNSDEKKLSFFTLDATGKAQSSELSFSYTAPILQLEMWSNSSSLIFIFWQEEESLQLLKWLTFDGKTLSPVKELSFTAPVETFSIAGKEEQPSLLYVLKNDLKKIFLKKYHPEKAWLEPERPLKVQEKLFFPKIYDFDLCYAGEHYYLALGTSGSARILYSKALEGEWKNFQPDPPLETTTPLTPKNTEEPQNKEKVKEESSPKK